MLTPGQSLLVVPGAGEDGPGRAAVCGQQVADPEPQRNHPVRGHGARDDAHVAAVRCDQGHGFVQSAGEALQMGLDAVGQACGAQVGVAELHQPGSGAETTVHHAQLTQVGQGRGEPVHGGARQPRGSGEIGQA